MTQLKNVNEDDMREKVKRLEAELKETKLCLSEVLHFIESAKNILEKYVYKNVYKT